MGDTNRCVGSLEKVDYMLSNTTVYTSVLTYCAHMTNIVGTILMQCIDMYICVRMIVMLNSTLQMSCLSVCMHVNILISILVY